jgi:hypothetical protein
LQLNVQCDKKATNKIFPFESLWRFLAVRMNPKKFPPGIGEQATLERGIHAALWRSKKVFACVSHKGIQLRPAAICEKES